MKHTNKLWLSIAIIAIVVFAVGSCKDGDDGAHTHTWGEWVVTTAATCMTEGVETKTCTQDATHTETRTVNDPNAHNMQLKVGGQVRIAPTCIDTGIGETVCANGCGKTEEEGVIPELGHDLKQLVGGVTTASTCTDEGVGVMKCDRANCNHEEAGGVLALDENNHTMGDYKQIIEPTCYSKGVNQRTCNGCNHPDPITQEGAGTIAHTMSDWHIITPATCIATGLRESHCRVDGCGYEDPATTIAEDKSYSGHDWLYDSNAVESTCVIDGHGRRSCQRGGTCTVVEDLANLGIDANNHKNLSADFQTTVQPTCIATGESYKFCSDCQKHDKYHSASYKEVPERGHDMINNWVTTRHPTCTANGDRERVCNRANCDHKEIQIDTVNVAALGGHQILPTIPATCTNANIRYTCTRTLPPNNTACSHASADMHVGALGHEGTLTPYAATCTTAGNSADLSGNCVRFAQCGHVVTGTVLPALGHDHNSSLICKRTNCDHQYAIGDEGPAGGIIVYVAPTGFTVTGTGSFTAYYLEAAPANMATTLAWASSEYLETDISGTGTAIGTGKENTRLILEKDLTAPAALACKNYTGGGKTDWFLPSEDEQREMYNARSYLGISSNAFWTSSQPNGIYVRYTNFENINMSNVGPKNRSYSVRACRAF